jgi:hypothetical protein
VQSNGQQHQHQHQHQQRQQQQQRRRQQQDQQQDQQQHHQQLQERAFRLKQVSALHGVAALKLRQNAELREGYAHVLHPCCCCFR